MSSLVIQHGLLGLVRLLTTAVVAGWISSPMSWSPDSQWLSYTVAPSSGRDVRAQGWIFEGSRDRPTATAGDQPSALRVVPGRMSYRIWATQTAAESSALLEESAWPLTAPSWSPVGRSLAFGR